MAQLVSAAAQYAHAKCVYSDSLPGTSYDKTYAL